MGLRGILSASVLPTLLVGIAAFLLGVFLNPGSDWVHPRPWPSYMATTHLQRWLSVAVHRSKTPAMRVLELNTGMQAHYALRAALQFKIADALATHGALNKEELAKAVGGAVPDRLERLMYMLLSVGVFAIDPKDPTKYINNDLSEVMRWEHPTSFAPIMSHFMFDVIRTWENLYSSVKEGGNAFVKYEEGGLSFWEFLEANPERQHNFARAMTGFDALGAVAIAQDGPLAHAKRVVDIGGSRGHFLARILRTYPHLQGAVFDLPTVIKDSTRPAWSEGGEFSDVKDRVELFEGSFFDVNSLPRAQAGDIWLMRFILHDWSDDQATTILTNLRKAVGLSGQGNVTLDLVELDLPDRGTVDPLAWKYGLDLHMMLKFEAKERTVSEWKSLLSQSGWEFVQRHPTRSIFHHIEARSV